jgi:hypothetical protein
VTFCADSVLGPLHVKSKTSVRVDVKDKKDIHIRTGRFLATTLWSSHAAQIFETHSDRNYHRSHEKRYLSPLMFLQLHEKFT